MQMIAKLLACIAAVAIGTLTAGCDRSKTDTPPSSTTQPDPGAPAKPPPPPPAPQPPPEK